MRPNETAVSRMNRAARRALGRRTHQRVFLFAMWLVAGNAAAWAAPPMLAVERTDGGCRLTAGDVVLGTYVTNDAEITRPFWMNLKTLTGREVTRPRPLGPDDLDDHAAMHPGVWIAFGDVNGHDDWRLKTGVRHAGYASGPAIKDGAFEMTVQNEYLTEAGDPFMRETARWRARVVEDAWLLSVATKFETIDETPAVFGDQEEMGLGVRLAKSIAEKTSDGTVRDSEGRSGAEDVWGHSAAWCDYSAMENDRRFGITLYASPGNFRSCWWHVRDTGLMVANPVGRSALAGGEWSQVRVRPKSPVILRFALRVYDSPNGGATDPSLYAKEALGDQR